jgi:hypothetical protein
MLNKHQLSRTISEPVKREVRRRAGFGCVKCGQALCHYDHLDPPFEEAREHHPDGIVLLCGGCHDLKTRGVLSADTVRRHAANPVALSKGFSFGAFDMQSNRPILHVASNKAENCPIFFRLDGLPILSIKGPEVAGGPFRVSADFVDRHGKQTVRIVDNEWRVRTGSWDVRAEGREIKVFTGAKKIDLVLRTEPPHNFHVDRLNMRMNGFWLRIIKDRLVIITPGKYIRDFTGVHMVNARSVFDLDGDECLFAVGSQSHI